MEAIFYLVAAQQKTTVLLNPSAFSLNPGRDKQKYNIWCYLRYNIIGESIESVSQWNSTIILAYKPGNTHIFCQE